MSTTAQRSSPSAPIWSVNCGLVPPEVGDAIVGVMVVVMAVDEVAVTVKIETETEEDWRDGRALLSSKRVLEDIRVPRDGSVTVCVEVRLLKEVERAALLLPVRVVRGGPSKMEIVDVMSDMGVGSACASIKDASREYSVVAGENCG